LCVSENFLQKTQFSPIPAKPQDSPINPTTSNVPPHTEKVEIQPVVFATHMWQPYVFLIAGKLYTHR
jgi:hypothetical protein